MTKAQALKKAQSLWKNAQVKKHPPYHTPLANGVFDDTTHSVGENWGWAFMAWGTGNSWEEAFQDAAEHGPRKKKQNSENTAPKAVEEKDNGLPF